MSDGYAEEDEQRDRRDHNIDDSSDETIDALHVSDCIEQPDDFLNRPDVIRDACFVAGFTRSV